MKVSVLVARMAFSLLVATTLAQAQTYPAKPVKIIAGFPPGGAADLLARVVADKLSALLGQTFVVENRPGAGGTIGTSLVAKAAADGTTLVLSAASHTINGSLYAKLPYDPIKDFTGMAHIGNASYVLIINGEVPAKNVAEFIRHAKSNPGKMNYATAGNGSATHLSMAYFNGLAGIDLVHVPFKATGEAVNEVLVGRAQAVIAANIGAIPYVKDARVRLIGVTSAKRSKFLPEIPAIAESGLPGYAFDSWFGLLGPAGTPKPVVDQVNAAMARLLKDPVILDRLAKQGIEPQAMTSDEFNRLLRADFERMSKVVKASGARVD